MNEKKKKVKVLKEARIELRISPKDKEVLLSRAKAAGTSLSTYINEVVMMYDPHTLKTKQEIIYELINLGNCLENNDIEGAKGCVNKLWKII